MPRTIPPIWFKVSERLAAGEAVKISGFGTFTLRDKKERVGRNPKSGEPAPISARRVVVFKPSLLLKRRTDRGVNEAGGNA